MAGVAGQHIWPACAALQVREPYAGGTLLLRQGFPASVVTGSLKPAGPPSGGLPGHERPPGSVGSNLCEAAASGMPDTSWSCTCFACSMMRSSSASSEKARPPTFFASEYPFVFAGGVCVLCGLRAGLAPGLRTVLGALMKPPAPSRGSCAQPFCQHGSSSCSGPPLLAKSISLEMAGGCLMAKPWLRGVLGTCWLRRSVPSSTPAGAGDDAPNATGSVA